MRIVAGRMRGLRLAALGRGDPAAHLRPTADRVRESLFSLLASRHGAPEEGAHVLDLFAGTGALGLEALSRGAGTVTFVENGRKAGVLIADNIARARAEGACRLLARDARRPGRNDGPPARLVFLDPPYGKVLGTPALQAALSEGWIAPDAVVVWEDVAPQTVPDGFVHEDARAYGDTHVTILRATSLS